MFHHPPFPQYVSHTLWPNNFGRLSVNHFFHIDRSCDILSSLRMYFNAKVSCVSFLSTIRTLPKAPLPTTRSNLKWLRLTGISVSYCHAAQTWLGYRVRQASATLFRHAQAISKMMSAYIKEKWEHTIVCKNYWLSLVRPHLCKCCNIIPRASTGERYVFPKYCPLWPFIVSGRCRKIEIRSGWAAVAVWTATDVWIRECDL